MIAAKYSADQFGFGLGGNQETVVTDRIQLRLSWPEQLYFIVIVSVFASVFVTAFVSVFVSVFVTVFVSVSVFLSVFVHMNFCSK